MKKGSSENIAAQYASESTSIDDIALAKVTLPHYLLSPSIQVNPNSVTLPIIPLLATATLASAILSPAARHAILKEPNAAKSHAILESSVLAAFKLLMISENLLLRKKRLVIKEERVREDARLAKLPPSPPSIIIRTGSITKMIDDTLTEESLGKVLAHMKPRRNFTYRVEWLDRLLLHSKTLGFEAHNLVKSRYPKLPVERIMDELLNDFSRERSSRVSSQQQRVLAVLQSHFEKIKAKK